VSFIGFFWLILIFFVISVGPQRGHFWLSWKVYYAKLNSLLDEYEATTMMCVPTVTEVLHAKGAIRSVGSQRDPAIFEKPMLDTVFINTYKATTLMRNMPATSAKWKEWEVCVPLSICVYICEDHVCICMYTHAHENIHTYAHWQNVQSDKSVCVSVVGG